LKLNQLHDIELKKHAESEQRLSDEISELKQIIDRLENEVAGLQSTVSARDTEIKGMKD
jgi:predicted  nucleic acid-binding Zn-ribbon protein